MIYVFFSKHPMLIVSEGNPLWWCHIPEFYNPRRGIYISWCSWEGHRSTERDWSKPHSLFELRGTKYKTSCFNSSLCRVRKIGGWEDKLVPIKKKEKNYIGFITILDGHFYFVPLMRGRMKESSELCAHGKTQADPLLSHRLFLAVLGKSLSLLVSQLPICKHRKHFPAVLEDCK